MAEEWFFFNSGENDGLTNMVIDEVLAKQIVPELKKPVLRFYRWRPYTISLGYHQSIDEFELEKCRKDGIGLVRRPTGGRAVLHAQELTYSVVLPEGSDFYAPDIFTTYNKISSGLLEGLKLFGVQAELTRRDEDEEKSGEYKQHVPCFSTSAKYEIAYQGKKLVGSAQRRYENSILQHGSILTGSFHVNLAKYVRLKNVSERRFMQELAVRTAVIEEILGKPVNFDELTEALKEGFQKKFDLRFTKFNFLPHHLKLIEDRKKTYPNIGGNHHEA